MKKIAAFTLLELLIGMIISSIVISFGYATYSLIYKQYLSYKTVKAKMMETTQLYSALSSDLFHAQMASFHEHTLLLYNKNKTELKYDFYENDIVRKTGEVVDSFHIAAMNRKEQFLFPDNKQFLTQLSFEINVLDEPEVFNFTKQYCSETLMNYEFLIKANH